MRYRDGILYFDEVAAPALIERFGSPIYVYEKAVLLRQIDRVRGSFRDFPFRPFYALKANANAEILRTISEAGFGFDAVSPGEIQLLRRIGVSGDRIWFTCSNVSDADLLDVGDPAIVVNLNGMSELDRCVRLKLPNPVALRINPSVGAGHHRDVVTAGNGVKFGFDLAEVVEAARYAEAEGIEVVGVHSHIGSGVDSLPPFLESAGVVIEIAESIPTVKWVNLGGGFGIPYKPGEPEFPIEEYGIALREMFGERLRSRGLTAILEPGRYVVAQCGTLLASVTAKRVSEGIEWLGCDTGFNHLARPSKYGAYHHILNASRGVADELRESWNPERPRAEYVVAGNICESGDVFTRTSDGEPCPRLMPSTRIDDILAFCDAGAYGYSMSSTYNARSLPPEIMVYGADARLIRRRLSFEDFCGDPT